MRKLRVLYVIDHLGGGGAENQFVEIVKRIAQDPDIEVRCFLSEGKGIRYEALAAAGVDIVTGGEKAKGRQSLLALKRLKRLYREYSPDVVHVFLMYSIFVSALILMQDRPRFFLATEFSAPDKILEEVRFWKLKRLLLKWAYKRLDHMVTTSTAVRKEMVHTGYLPFQRISVIHEGVDLRFCRPGDKAQARRQTSLPEEGKFICIVGTLVERKGHSYLLDAFSRVSKNFEGLKLYIVGDGPCKGALEQRAQQLGIADSVVFTGYRQDAKEIIKASDIFCLPSLYEGMPNVVMESMALGTPVITTARYGALDLIDDNVSGKLVEPGDAEGIAQAISALLSDEVLYSRIVEEARAKIQNFDFSVTATQYLELYKESVA